jgi:hypothetical protein
MFLLHFLNCPSSFSTYHNTEERVTLYLELPYTQACMVYMYMRKAQHLPDTLISVGIYTET